MRMQSRPGPLAWTGACVCACTLHELRPVTATAGDDKQQEFTEYGLQYITNMCKKLVDSGLARAHGRAI